MANISDPFSSDASDTPAPTKPVLSKMKMYTGPSLRSIDEDGNAVKKPVRGVSVKKSPYEEAVKHLVEEVKPIGPIEAYGPSATPVKIDEAFYGGWHPKPPVAAMPAPAVAPAPAVVAAMAMAQEAMAAAQVNLGSLKSFVASGQDLDGSGWTSALIMDALSHELWRPRELDEVIKEGDLLSFEAVADQPAFFDLVRGYKDTTLTKEQVELHGYTVWTLEGGGKKRKPVVYHETNEYPGGLLSVPKGTFVKMPTDQNEARRFFSGDVFVMEVPDRGKMVKVFAPMPTRFSDRTFRQVFSRVFPDIAKRHFKDHIKGLIEGRGLGVQLKRGISINRILDMIDGRKRGIKIDKHKPMSIEQVAAKLNLSQELVAKVVARRDYQRREDGRPVDPFIKRMEARDLTPLDYRYEKAIGVEIEAITPVSPSESQARMPSYVRVTTDGSLRDDKDRKLSPGGSNQASELAKGLDGLYGLEYRMLIRRDEMEVRIIRAVNAIHNLGAKVNKSCGLHVHFDMRHKSREEVHALHDKVTKWLKCLRELLPPSRRANQYCSFEPVQNKHHWAVSLDAYDKHKTLEVRVHSSTLNTTKIIQWIRLCETVIESKFPPFGATTTIDALKMLNLTEADRTFWLKRHQQLNPELYKGEKVSLSFLGERAEETE